MAGDASPRGPVQPSTIVGLGASAGGLEPLQRFFRRMPTGSGMGFVVVQHLAPDHNSRMVEILARDTALRVVEASDGMPVATDTVHVLPPGKELRIENGRLRLIEPVQARGYRRPIDEFLHALALDQRENSVAIIFSGAGDDGTRGVVDIKDSGGMVMVQQPEEAHHDSMPRSALASGRVDYQLPVEDMPGVLMGYVHHNESFDEREFDLEASDEGLENVLGYVHGQTGHDFRHYKPGTLLRRIHRRMRLKGLEQLDEYLHLLRDQPAEIKNLVRDMLICVTGFFRNPEAWEYLGREVLPALVAEKDTREPLRIWVAGCATGEEAYSMAMLVTETLAGRDDIPVQIFATDISNNALKTARAGQYPEGMVDQLSPARLGRFLVHEDDCLRIVKSLRERVVFAAHDLQNDPPFSRVDLVCCRNLLIYLEPQAQQQVLAKLHFALRPGGYLFLGSAETPDRLEHAFEPVSADWHVYRRLSLEGRTSVSLDDFPRSSVDARNREFPVRGREPLLREQAGELLLRHTRSAVLLVDEHHRLLYLGGNGEPFLSVPTGEQHQRVLEWVRPGLHLKLREALRRATASRSPVPVEDALVRLPDGRRLHVGGLVERVERAGQRPRFFINLEERVAPAPANPEPVLTGTPETRDELVQQLEREVRQTREELSGTVQELEQVNEELRLANEEALATNEELQAGAEELESSREELQSLNEELSTLNAELETKIRQLESSNDDLNNLLTSTRIAVVFLDTGFRIRNFTPEAGALFNVLRSDVGRPISDLAHKFSESASLLADAGAVLKHHEPVEREVTDDHGRWFQRRLLPYRTDDRRVEGVVLTFQEITPLKDTQQRLADREQRLRLVTDAMPVLISYVDREQIYRFANAAYERWFGLEREAVVGRPMAEVLGEATFQHIRPQVERALAGEQFAWEAFLPYRFGGERYVKAEYIPHHDDHGQVLGYYALVQDISEQKAAKDAVERSAREFQAIFDLSGSGNILADPKTGRLLRVNRRFCEIVGYSAEELQQMSKGYFTHPDDQDFDREQIGRVLHGEETHWSSEKRYIRKDGGIRWVLVNGSVVCDEAGEPRHMVATVTDITDRKRTEDELRETAERFQTLADNIVQFAWMTDASGWILWYNRRWFEYTGTTLEETQGWGWTKVHHPDHVDRVVAKIRHCFERGEVWEDTFPLRGRDDRYRWFLSRAVPIHDAEGRVQRFFGTNTDITERMEMEEALKEADRRKDEFLASLAHELRNPMAPLRHGLELLGLDGDDPDTLREVRNMMQRQLGQLTRLVDDLLDISRITLGRVELRRQPVSLSEVLHSAVESVQTVLDQQDHRLNVNIPAEPLMLEADPHRLAQLFANLLHNAAKFSAPGSRIWLSVEPLDTEVRVRVCDEGAGIEAAMHEQVFEMFVQGRGERGVDQQGLGIGLTLVKSLVEMHGGSVRVYSEGSNQGSEFLVSLPRTPAVQPREAAAEIEKASTSSRSRRVLVVDDNRDAVTGLTALLKIWGHQFAVAHDGGEALEVAEQFRPEVVLLDLGLPVLNGVEVGRQLRQRPWGQHIRIVAVTGWGQPEDRRRTREAGFDDHLVKPIEPAVLREHLAVGVAGLGEN